VVDKKCEHEKLIKSIEESKLTKFSMGYTVVPDICAVCGEKPKLDYQVLQEDDGYCD